jgi:hypothetical protein
MKREKKDMKEKKEMDERERLSMIFLLVVKRREEMKCC